MKILVCIFIGMISAACSVHIEKFDELNVLPPIFPDITGTTIPPNIAPLNFYIRGGVEETVVDLACNTTQLRVSCDDSVVIISPSKWKSLVQKSDNQPLQLTVYARSGKRWVRYKPFEIAIAKEPIDPYVVYRLIPPGYELWNEMGIYQMDLTNGKQSAIYESRLSDNNCVNCHSFAGHSSQKMVFHSRGKHGGTVLIRGEDVDVLKSDNESIVASLTYPSWHPEGRYIAFSSNNTRQLFHAIDKNRIEVFDFASEIVLYDTETNRLTAPFPITERNRTFNTYPSFSADGKRLYFCSAPFSEMPSSYDSLFYNICSIEFEPSSGTFGTSIDTLLNGQEMRRSLVFPRVSPSGRYLLYTASAYGCFPIWHRDAELEMIDLHTRQKVDCSVLNSDDTESYHCWSSNSHWIVFSSRRIDGLYTNLYFSHIDDKGALSKPFLMPQRSPLQYEQFMKSYNIPEFIKEKCEINQRTITKGLLDSTRLPFEYQPTN